MPISQQRVIAILEEAERLRTWAEGLRHDLLQLLAASDMGQEAKLEAVSAILEISSIPTCVQIAIERSHFRRAERRNIRNAEKMRIKRAGKEQDNERDDG